MGRVRKTLVILCIFTLIMVSVFSNIVAHILASEPVAKTVKVVDDTGVISETIVE